MAQDNQRITIGEQRPPQRRNQEAVQNTFDKGMYGDALESLQPPGTYRFMLNGIHEGVNITNSGVVNEQSNRRVQGFTGTIVGSRRYEKNNSTILFINNGNSEIWLFNHDTHEKTFVVSDTEYGCNWEFSTCEWIKNIEIKVIEPCSETMIYWSSGCTYHRANITVLLDQARRKELECHDFDLMKCECITQVNANRLNDGNDLLNGAYQFVVQLEDEDANTTNWFNVNQPTFIGSSTNQPGERSKQSIRVRVSSLSNNYNKINIAVIKTIGGSKTAAFLGTRSYNSYGVTFDYYATGQELRIMDLTEILAKKRTYIKGQDLIQKESRLWLYNVKQEKNLNYQKHASDIKLTYYVSRISYEDYKKSPELWPSLMRDEVYAFAIVPQYCDGTVGVAYHIPGPSGLYEDLACECTEGRSRGFPANTASRTELFSNDPASESSSSIQSYSLNPNRSPNTGPPLAPEEGKEDDFYARSASIILDLDTPPEDLEDCADCASSSINSSGDHKDIDLWLGNWVDRITDLFRTDKEPKITSGSLREAVKNLIDEINLFSSSDSILPPDTLNKSTQSSNRGPDVPSSNPEEFPKILSPVYNPDTNDCDILYYQPGSVSRGTMGSYISCETYPYTLDCDGEYIYGDLAGEHIRHHRTPSVDVEPHYVSYSNGVVSQKDPGQDEYANTYIHLLGITVSNVYLPTQDELPKPLCPDNPFKIVMVKREAHTKSVIAKGLFTGTFEGSTYGIPYAFPNHAVNSFERVDRHLEDEPGDSHIGTRSSIPLYNFHSPDTNMKEVPLSGIYVRPELEIYGSGYRYGVQAQGKKVFNAYENQVDQRGTRQAVNLNHYVPIPESQICISGQTYAEPDSIVRKGDGIDLALMNAYREKSVYLQLDNKLPPLTKGVDNEYDASFVGDTLDHDSPIEKSSGIYGAIRRHNKCMYGNVESLRYIDTGMQISSYRIREGLTTFRQIGDVFIGPYSFRRTGYVSNKVGTSVVDGAGGHALTRCAFNTNRDICRPINKKGDSLTDYVGFKDYLKLPISGETCDARNYTNLHPGLRAAESFGGQVTEPAEDYYYPGTITTLIHFWVETDVNLSMRTRGTEEVREVYYKGLGNIEYDSDAPQKSPWEKSWMNDFHVEQIRPSKWQVAVNAFIRSVIGMLFPLGIAGLIADIQTGTDIVTTMWMLPIFTGLFTVLDKGPFSRTAMKNLLGYPDCKTDEDGGTEDTNIRGFRDNYHIYNPDYSTINDLNISYAMPDPFNTCLIAGTEILMSDRSRKKIEDIVCGDEVLSYDFEKGKYANKNVTNFWDNGKKDVYRIQFRGSYVDATIDHRWFVRDRNKRDGKSDLDVVTTHDLIEDTLKPKSKRKYSVVFSSSIPNLVNATSSLFRNKYEAYLFGMYIAEGCSRHKRNGKQKGIFLIAQYKKHTLKKLLEVVTKSKLSYSIVSQGVNIRNLRSDLESLFLNCGSKFNKKHIPEIVFKENNEILESIYEGLMDGDGHTTKRKIDKRGVTYNRVEKYHTSSKQLNEDVRLLSRFIGKPHYTSLVLPERYTMFGDRNYLVKKSFTSSFNKNSFLIQNEKNGTGKLHIQSIIKLENKGRVYDIEVEDTHSFILADSGAITHNCDCDDCINDETTNEIWFSNKHQIVSSRDSYRNFKANNYLNIPAHSGRIRNMFILDNKFYVHTTDGIWLIQYSSGSVSFDNKRALILGGGDLLTQPLQILEGVSSGYMGLEDPNSAVVTQLGYLFVDRESKKLIRFSAEGMVDMSITGMRSFFRENLAFSDLGDCIDERGDKSYLFGVDYRHNRIMFTKRDGDASFTMSFDPIRNIWISYHSYIPRGYIWDRGQMFSFTDNEIYIHDQSPSNYQNFYGKSHPHILEFISVNVPYAAHIYNSSFFETEASKSNGGILNLRNRKITFNKAIFSNSVQSTELLTLEPRDATDNDASRKSKETYPIIGVYRRATDWRVNDLQDTIIDANEPIWLDINELPFKKHNISNIQRSPDIYRNNILFDKYLRNYLIFDNFSDVQLVTKFSITYVNIPIQ